MVILDHRFFTTLKPLAKLKGHFDCGADRLLHNIGKMRTHGGVIVGQVTFAVLEDHRKKAAKAR